MKRSYRLVGLDCANCAAKMETDINKLDGVIEASVNHMTTKLVIEAEDDKFDDIIAAAEKIVKKYEPDVVVKRA